VTVQLPFKQNAVKPGPAEFAAQPSVQFEPAVRFAQLAFQFETALGGVAGRSGQTFTETGKSNQADKHNGI
jgi:hypothetical protein